MERLTIMTPKGPALKMDATYPNETAAKKDLMKKYLVAVDRLAAYEDTGLEPETVSKIRDVVLDVSGDIDRLRELAQADKEGRWIYGEDLDLQCSLCGGDALTEGDYRQVKSNYCPCCGAKMDNSGD